MSDEPFMFGVPEEKPVSPKKEKPKKLVDNAVSSEKVMTFRIVHEDGTVSSGWADKSSIHPDALKYYEKFKEFY